MMAPPDSDGALQAAIDGNLRLLKKMANKVSLREVKDGKGLSALHCAAANGHLEVCRFLVEESGLDVNSTSDGSGTPIHFAAAGGNVRILGYLLDRGGDPAIQDSMGGCTPLHAAVENGHCEAVRLLLSKGVGVGLLSSRGTPLHSAAAGAHDQVVKILLEHGADPNEFVNNFFSPLMVACWVHSLKCMKLLVEAGADVNYVSPHGPSILMLAVDRGSVDIVKFLLDAGADANICDVNGVFPIMMAAAGEHRKLVEILFPRTRPIPAVPAWSIDGIIITMKYLGLEPQEPVEKQLADVKSKGKEAFANGDFLYATYFYELAIGMDPLDATLFANRSLCWQRLREGEKALSDARRCKELRPSWAKAWYREGMALSLLKNCKGAVDAFSGALKLDPANEDIKKALREAMESMRNDGHSGEPNP